MKNVIYLLMILILSGCNVLKRSIDKTPPSQSDSVVKETVTIRSDTTIYVYIKGDTVHDTIKVFIDREGLVQSAESFQHTQYAWSRAYVLDSKLHHETGQFEAAIAKTVKGAIEKTKESFYKEKVVVPEPVVTNIITGWQWFQIWLGRILGVLFLIYIGVIIIRMRLKIPGF